MKPTAEGWRHRKRLRLVCDIDPETFKVIRDTELPGCGSMAERIRTLLEWGLEAAAEQENNRP